jgi:hypothetical protein
MTPTSAPSLTRTGANFLGAPDTHKTSNSMTITQMVTSTMVLSFRMLYRTLFEQFEPEIAVTAVARVTAVGELRGNIPQVPLADWLAAQ